MRRQTSKAPLRLKLGAYRCAEAFARRAPVGGGGSGRWGVHWGREWCRRGVAYGGVVGERGC